MSSSNAVDAARFTATHWSVVLAAAQRDTPDSALALNELCRAYWLPLYVFVRRQGETPHDAQDLTQAFFARFLEKNYLSGVDKSKGRFRSFLLASLKHFLSHEWEKARAQKRGGGKTFVPIDGDWAETHYTAEPAEPMTPEKIFERRWALTLLGRAMSRLREEYVAQNKTELFDNLKATLTEPRGTIAYSEIAMALKMNDGAARMAIHRLRRRYREILRMEIAQTVAQPEEIDDEVRHIIQVLSD